MKLSDFDFHLPDELIAQHPPKTRGDSRLLVTYPHISDQHFSDLPKLLKPNDLLIMNDTKVIKARLFGNRASGGKIEFMVERIVSSNEVVAMIRASNAPKPGTRLHFPGNTVMEISARQGRMHHVRIIHSDLTIDNLLEQHGELPLPPYITHAADTLDEDRYQTVFAREAGAVAAPTAGLHFTEGLLDQIKSMGVSIHTLTLHVGAGTFLPVSHENITEHVMHKERFQISGDIIGKMIHTKDVGGRIIAVGTTSLRALEAFCHEAGIDFASESGRKAAAQYVAKGYSGDTDIFITPGFQFKAVDCLQTNFHLPKSTLLMLVSAFCGHERIMNAYRHAVEQRYRFFSYGDAMWLERTGLA